MSPGYCPETKHDSFFFAGDLKYVHGSPLEKGILIFTSDPKDASLRTVSYRNPS